MSMEKNKNKKIKQEEVTKMELIWENKKDLVELGEEPTFTNYVLGDVYKTVERAINDNLPRVELFNIYNVSIIIEVEKSQYSSILEKVLNMYVLEENYEECLKIKELIKKI